jgi:hypothetical protein
VPPTSARGGRGLRRLHAREVGEQRGGGEGATEERLDHLPRRTLETEAVELLGEPRIERWPGLGQRPAQRLRPRAQVGDDHRAQRIVHHVSRSVDELAAHRPPRPLRVWHDAQVLVGQLAPHVVGIGLGIAVHAHLEQSPADVEHDAGVLRAQAGGEGCGGAEPALLPRGLVGLLRDELRQRFGESVAVRPVGKRGPGADRLNVDGVTGLVQQLGEVVEAADAVGGEDPRLARCPSAGGAPRPAAESGEGDRRLVFARREVVADSERLRVGAQGGVEPIVDLAQPRERHPLGERAIERAACVVEIPRLERFVRRRVAPGSENVDEPALGVGGRHAERGEVARDVGIAGAPALGGERDHPAVEARRRAVAVDALPDGLEGEEETAALVALCRRRQSREDGQPVDRLALVAHVALRLGVAGVKASLQFDEAGVIRRWRSGAAVRRVAVGARRGGLRRRQRRVERAPHRGEGGLVDPLGRCREGRREAGTGHRVVALELGHGASVDRNRGTACRRHVEGVAQLPQLGEARLHFGGVGAVHGARRRLLRDEDEQDDGDDGAVEHEASQKGCAG